MYSKVTNLVPFLSSNSGGRSILGTAQMVQAVPLKDREAPLVRSGNLEDSKVTVTGEHGISSEHKVTEQARDVRARNKNPLSILNRTSD